MPERRDRFVLSVVVLTCWMVRIGLSAEVRAEKEPESGTVVIYDSSEEDIAIRDRSLTYKLHQARFDPDRPQDPNPRGVETEIRQGELTADELKEFLTFVESSGFFELKDEYGGEPERRHYAYTIHVKQGDPQREKKVTYRARPDAEKRPEAFSKVESRLKELARAVTERVDGEETGR